MSNTTVTSKQFTINWRDFFKGLILAVGTPVLYLLQEMIPGWNADPLIKAGLSALITYLLKNLFTPSAIVVTNADTDVVKAVKEGDAKVTVTPT